MRIRVGFWFLIQTHLFQAGECHVKKDFEAIIGKAVVDLGFRNTFLADPGPELFGTSFYLTPNLARGMGFSQ